MTRRTNFRPQAEAEVLEVRNWHEDRRQGLGNEFGAAVGNLVARITENPLAFPRVCGEIRRATLDRFPHAIYFRLSGDEVIVLAVHGPGRVKTPDSFCDLGQRDTRRSIQLGMLFARPTYAAI